MPEVQEVFRMATQKVRPDPGAMERQLQGRRRRDMRRRAGVFALTAAIGVGLIVLLVVQRADRPDRSPADDPTVTPVPTAHVQAAEEFVEAFGAFDAEGAMALVADGADLAGVIDGQVPQNTRGLAHMLALLEAQGYEQTSTSCTSSTFAGNTFITCPIEWHGIRSDEIDRGPYTGDFTFTIRDGTITRASLSWDIEDFSVQMWEPFRDWVRSTYPDDAAAMYVDNFGNYRLTERSVDLWERHTKEYVEVVRASEGP